MSDNIYRSHKTQTDKLIAEKRINVLQDIRIIKIMIYRIQDFADNNKDCFWAHIRVSMIDYMISETNPDYLVGYNDKAEEFEESWKFVRINNSWVLDEIDIETGMFDLLKKSYRE